MAETQSGGTNEAAREAPTASNRSQSFPRIRVGKQPNADGDHEVTITVVPAPVTDSEDPRWRGVGTAPPPLGLREPEVQLKVNETGNGFDVYVRLFNDDDEVTIGRPPSQGPARGPGSG